MNTASSLLLIFAGFYLLAMRDRALGFMTIVVGLASIFCHASQTWLGDTLDFAGQFLILSYFLALGFGRALGWSAWHRVIVWTSLSVLSVGLVFYQMRWGITVFALMFFPYLAIEARNYFKDPAPAYRHFGLAALAFALAFAAFGIDLLPNLCLKDNHWVQLHAVWHGLVAVGLVLISGHYRAAGAGP